VLGGLGAVLALVLLVAARKFAVYEDPLIGAVEGALPGANCGACGQAGCHAFAETLVRTHDEGLFCPPGGSDVAQKVAEILGMKASDKVAPVAVVMCRGNREAASFVGRYDGIEDCRAAALVDGGSKVCPYGCFGLGSCRTACDYGAIEIVDGIAVVHEEKCVGCGACVKACPRRIIRMAPRDVRVFVACASHDNGKAVRAYCQVGCIGCKKCVKACGDDAMQFDNFLARVDHAKCTACGACVGACPRDIIVGVHLSEEARQKAYPPDKKHGDDDDAKPAAAAAGARAAVSDEEKARRVAEARARAAAKKAAADPAPGGESVAAGALAPAATAGAAEQPTGAAEKPGPPAERAAPRAEQA
jgi:RnfABCDGE-type electron transport complex B subunit